MKQSKKKLLTALILSTIIIVNSIVTINATNIQIDTEVVDVEKEITDFDVVNKTLTEE